jgi:multiple sugar transport system substrate-binding protein
MSQQKQFTRRKFLQSAALASGAAVLAACSPTAAPTTAPAAEATKPAADAPTSVPAKQEEIHLKYITADRELGRKVKELSVGAFNDQMAAAGKPWRIDSVFGPATDNDYRAKLTLDAAAGTIADIFDIYQTDLADFTAAGYLMDMRKYLEGWSEWAQVYDVLKPLAEFEGKLVGIPGGSTMTFFVRKDVLDAAGISTANPKTWDEFYERCDQIKQKTDAKPVGIPAGTAWGGGSFEEGFKMVWLSFAGTIYDEADKKWVVSSPNLLKAFQVYEKLATSGWLTVDELLATNPWEPIKYQEFPAGKCAIVTGGEWQWTFDWGPAGATPIEGLYEKVIRWEWPTDDGKPFTYVDGGVGTVVSAKTAAPDGAFEFLKVANSAEVGCKALPIYIGGPNPFKDFSASCPDYKTIVNGKMYEASQLFTTGRRYSFNKVGLEKITDGIAKATEDVITKKKTSQEAMDSFAAEMLDVLGSDKAKKG